MEIPRETESYRKYNEGGYDCIEKHDGSVLKQRSEFGGTEFYKDYFIVKELKFTLKKEKEVDLFEAMGLPQDWEVWKVYGDQHPGAILSRKIIQLPGFYSDYQVKLDSKNGRQVLVEEQIKTTEPFFAGEKSLLMLAHEIGHAANNPSDPESIELDQEIYKRSENWSIENKPNIEELEKYEKLILGKERAAWAWTITRVKQLRKIGIDIAPNLKTLADFQQLIHNERLLRYTLLIEQFKKTAQGVAY